MLLIQTLTMRAARCAMNQWLMQAQMLHLVQIAHRMQGQPTQMNQYINVVTLL